MTEKNFYHRISHEWINIFLLTVHKWFWSTWSWYIWSLHSNKNNKQESQQYGSLYLFSAVFLEHFSISKQEPKSLSILNIYSCYFTYAKQIVLVSFKFSWENSSKMAYHNLQPLRLYFWWKASNFAGDLSQNCFIWWSSVLQSFSSWK